MKTKMPVAITLLFCVVMFTLQNTDVVTIKFFLWDFTMSRALMIFLVLTAGIIVGFFLGTMQRDAGMNKEQNKRLDSGS